MRFSTSVTAALPLAAVPVSQAFAISTNETATSPRHHIVSSFAADDCIQGSSDRVYYTLKGWTENSDYVPAVKACNRERLTPAVCATLHRCDMIPEKSKAH